MSNPFMAGANTQPQTTNQSTQPEQEAQAAQQGPAASTLGMSTPSQASGQPPRPQGNLSDMFARGSKAGDGAKIKDDMGAAVLVRPTEFIQGMKTSQGLADCVRADWVVLDGPNQGAVRKDSLVFNQVLISSLKDLPGTATPFLVGVVGMGEAKGGKSAPLLFLDPQPEHVELAVQAAQAHGWVATD